jgi:hypothetical protein
MYQEIELGDLVSGLVLCYSPRLWDNMMVTNLVPPQHHNSSNNNLDGCTLAQPHTRCDC